MNDDLSAWLYKQLYSGLIGTVLPVQWFGPKVPATESLPVPTGRLKLEIVAHCWKYAHLAVYQLSSLVNYPPQDIDVTYTLYYSDEDPDTLTLIQRFNEFDVPNLHWNWQPLPRNQLYRRAIGRNKSAKSTQADWVWFTDCDLIFHEHCLPSLLNTISGLQKRLVYPQSEQTTALLDAEHPMINLDPKNPTLVDIDTTLFSESKVSKATGPLQIVHGTVARTCGYCSDLRFFQQPSDRWRKTFEDTIFRRLIQDQGMALPIKDVHRIRHEEKGRYASHSKMSHLRQKVRKMTDNQNNSSENKS